MPQQTDLVVKNGAATPIDKTFTAISPASGDGGIASWWLREGSISAVFPVFTASATRTGNRSRNLKMKLRVPSSYNDAVTGLTSVGSAAEINFVVSIPDDFPEDKKADFQAFASNIVNTVLVKTMIKDALGAT